MIFNRLTLSLKRSIHIEYVLSAQYVQYNTEYVQSKAEYVLYDGKGYSDGACSSFSAQDFCVNQQLSVENRRNNEDIELYSSNIRGESSVFTLVF